MKLLKGIGIVLGLLLFPVAAPVAAIVWGVLTLRSDRARTSSARRVAGGVALAAGLLFAAVVWPGMIAGDTTDTTDTAAPSPASTPTTPPGSVSATPGVSVTPSAPPDTSIASVPPPVPPATAEATAPDDTTSAPAEAAGLVPVVGVVDGDTIKVRLDGRAERVRIIGIDTPELKGDECYARQATSRMQSLVQNREVRLEADPTQDDRDRYDRLLRHVVLADGRSVARVLIGEGYGREYTYSRAYAGQADYRAAENIARTQDLGLWGSCPAGGAPVPAPAPKDTARPAPAQAPADAGTCDIKGNINAEGEKIYHVPGGRSYAATRIDTAKGERMFCSESEAREAGWRAARG